MGRRTINAHKLTFNKLREPEHLLSPADINGETLIDIVERCALSLEEEGVIELRGDTHIVVGRVSRFNNNILIMEAMSGKSGEPGVLHDLEGVSDDIPIGENQAPMSGCRALLFCPGNGQMAMWFSEYSSRSSGARDLLALLKRRWPHLNTGAKFNDARVIMSDALLDEGKITEIEVRFTRLSSDLADGTQTTLGTYSSSFRPDRRRPLSAKLLDVFRKDPTKVFDYVELPAKEPVGREVYVSIDAEGHKRKIRISDPEDGFYYHEELNAPGEPISTDDELVEYCSDEATSYFDRSGFCWDSNWSRKIR